MSVVIYEKWRDEQAKATYPFVDTASLTDLGQSQLPLDLILDAVIYGPGIGKTTWLSNVSVGYDYITFTVSTDDEEVGSGTWSSNDPKDTVALRDTTNRPVATLIVNPVVANEFLLVNRGKQMSFASFATEFVITTVYFFNDGVDERQSEGVPLAEQGDLYFVGQNGVQLQVLAGPEIVDETGQQISIIVINAIGDPLAARATCDNFVAPQFITEVVFQRSTVTHSCNPGGSGNVWLLSASRSGEEPALRVTPTNRGIVVGLFGKEVKGTQ